MVDSGIQPSRALFPDSQEMLCPKCMYNLRGLLEQRCPECGEPFDSQRLDILRGNVQGIASAWETSGGRRGFVQTWWAVATEPRRFAAGFPGWHVEDRAVGYSAMCYLLAMTPIVCGWVALLAVDPVSRRATELLFVSLAAPAIGMPVCEMTTAAILAALVRPFYPRRAYHFWRGLTHYTSGFSCITGALVGAMMLIDAALHTAASSRFMGSGSPDAQGALLLLAMISIAVVYGWWVDTLGIMIFERSQPGARRILACAAPLVGTVVGAFLGGVVGAMCILP
ncbi:MAG: hypothetical protein IT449_01720 [Phycisphaerales bacterium]|nr:hypothetical protein [Phycisphaerales bacterium]